MGNCELKPGLGLELEPELKPELQLELKLKLVVAHAGRLSWAPTLASVGPETTHLRRLWRDYSPRKYLRYAECANGTVRSRAARLTGRVCDDHAHKKGRATPAPSAAHTAGDTNGQSVNWC